MAAAAHLLSHRLQFGEQRPASHASLLRPVALARSPPSSAKAARGPLPAPRRRRSLGARRRSDDEAAGAAVPVPARVPHQRGDHAEAGGGQVARRRHVPPGPRLRRRALPAEGESPVRGVFDPPYYEWCRFVGEVSPAGLRHAS
ncbi:hypothetical protein ZWY2020_006143 [Hordeum vulgare]|nr:hypothetical protein ZWY2020_006143 [Hordeum vulgare]